MYEFNKKSMANSEKRESPDIAETRAQPTHQHYLQVNM